MLKRVVTSKGVVSAVRYLHGHAWDQRCGTDGRGTPQHDGRVGQCDSRSRQGFGLLIRSTRRIQPKDAYVFVSERGGPIGPIGFPPTYPARRRGRQNAIPDPPAHASPCLWVQARERWPFRECRL
jgi:hypothetical protein